MHDFKKIEQNCLDVMSRYKYIDNNDQLAFQVGYYKSHAERLCAEVQFFKMELDQTIEDLRELSRDL